MTACSFIHLFHFIHDLALLFHWNLNQVHKLQRNIYRRTFVSVFYQTCVISILWFYYKSLWTQQVILKFLPHDSQSSSRALRLELCSRTLSMLHFNWRFSTDLSQLYVFLKGSQQRKTLELLDEILGVCAVGVFWLRFSGTFL